MIPIGIWLLNAWQLTIEVLYTFHKMKVYKCLFTQEELISDSYKQDSAFDNADFDDVAFEVKSSRVKKGGEDYGISNNDDDGGDLADAVETVVDVSDSFQLQETTFTKKDFQAYIKAYLGRVKKHLEEKNPDRVAPFMEGAQKVVKRILSDFDEFQFYLGPQMDTEAACVYAYYKGEEEAPRFVYLKDAMIEERF